MDVKDLKACISHDEATIRSFVRDPEYAEYYLQAVLADGDAEEIAEVQCWYDEAKARRQNLGYWSTVVDNAEKTAREGQNLDVVIALMTRALGILKSAVPVGA